MRTRFAALPIGLAAAAASVLGTGSPAQADQPTRFVVERTIPEIDVCSGQDVTMDFRFEYAVHDHEGADVTTVKGFMTDSLGNVGRSAEVEVQGDSTFHHFARWIVRNPITGTVFRMAVDSEIDPETGAEVVIHTPHCVTGG